jgi:hypothetical protein
MKPAGPGCASDAPRRPHARLTPDVERGALDVDVQEVR